MNENFENSSSGNGKHSLGDKDEARIWDYIDGFCEPPEKVAIQTLISENTEWRDKYRELLELHQLVQSSELDEPSLRFTKNIMEEISKVYIAPAAKNYINKKVIWSIGGFFITLIIGFLIYAIAQISWSEGSSDNMMGIDFSQINYGKMFNNNVMNVFMMLNVLAGLVLLDSYLANKRNKLSGKSS